MRIYSLPVWLLSASLTVASSITFTFGLIGQAIPGQNSGIFTKDGILKGNNNSGGWMIQWNARPQITAKSVILAEQDSKSDKFQIAATTDDGSQSATSFLGMFRGMFTALAEEKR